MIHSINHIGIAVKNLDESILNFKKLFNINDFHREFVEEQKVEIASFKVGDIIIELTTATDDTSPIKKFIDNRGEGIHHIAFNSDDIILEIERLINVGINIINKIPQIGAHNTSITFLHPKSTNGVLIEICQKI